MAICNYLAPNGEKSILAAALLQQYGPDVTARMWNYAHAHMDAYDRFDVNGEPIMDDVMSLTQGESMEELPQPMLENLDGMQQELRHMAVPADASFSRSGEDFQPANQEQADAITNIQKYIEDASIKPDDWFTLQGKAGTGKTTLVQEAIAPYVEAGKKVVIAAVAHKAKGVLDEKLTERFGKGTVGAYSIAALIGYVMDEDTGKFTRNPNPKAPRPPIIGAELVVIDEASMVNEEAMQLLMGMKPAATKIIFLGDSGQLPPIRDKNIMATGIDPEALSPTFTTKYKSELTERVRQGEDSPILPYADHFWDNSHIDAPVLDPTPADSHVNTVSDKGSLVFLNNSMDAMEAVMPLFKEATEKNNPNLVKIVVYMNSSKDTLNDIVRTNLWGDEADAQYVINDLVVFTGNNENRELTNGKEGQVVSVKRSEEGEMPHWKLEVKIGDKVHEVTMLDKSVKESHRALVTSLFAQARSLPQGSMERQTLNDEAWAESRKYTSMEYNYAITSHKSQGSTYNTVVVSVKDINRVTKTKNRTKSRATYTAITRASATVLLVDGTTTVPGDATRAVELGRNKKLLSPQLNATIKQGIKPDLSSLSVSGSGDIVHSAVSAKDPTTGEMRTVDFNGNPFWATEHGRIMSGKTGKEVYKGADNGTVVTTKKILALVQAQNRELASTEPARTEPGAPPVAKKADLSVKNVFKVTPIQAVDAKATTKASIATKYIGFGIDEFKGSRGSTNHYREEIEAQGNFANTGVYTAEDVVFLSAPGNRGPKDIWQANVAKIHEQVNLAVQAGATIVKDTEAYIATNAYNTGEANVSGYLKSLGYEYRPETINGVAVGVWGPKAATTDTKKEYKAAVTPKYTSKQQTFIGEDVDKMTGERPGRQHIVNSLIDLYTKAKENPEIEFTVPYEQVRDGYKQKNGYTTVEIAEFVTDMGAIPPNVKFTGSFYDAYLNLPANFAEEFPGENQAKRKNVNLNKAKVAQQLNQLSVPIYNQAGEQTGSFDHVKQHEAVEAITYFIYKMLRDKPGMSAITAMHSALVKFHSVACVHSRPLADGTTPNAQQGQDFWNVVNSFAFREESNRTSFAAQVMRHLESFGLKVKNKDRVLAAMEVNVQNVKKNNNSPVENIDLDFEDYSSALREVEQLELSEAEIEKIEGKTRVDFSDVSFELDPRDSASWRMKMEIGNIEDMKYERDADNKIVRNADKDSSVKLVATKNHLGAPKLVDFDDAYEKVMGLLADTPRNYDAYLQKLKANADINPIFQSMANRLEMEVGTPKAKRVQLQNEFVKVMSKHYQRYMMVTNSSERQADGSYKWVLNPFDANQSSLSRELLKTWVAAQKLSRAMTVLNGERVMDVELLANKPMAWVKAFNLAYTRNMVNKAQLAANPTHHEDIHKAIIAELKKTDSGMGLDDFLKNTDEHAKSFITNMLELHGIEFTPDMVDDLVSRSHTHMNKTKLNSGIGGMFSFLTDGAPAGLISVFVTKAAGLSGRKDSLEDNNIEDVIRKATEGNPLIDESTTMGILSKIAAAHTRSLTTSSHRGGNGKLSFDYVANTALSLKGNMLFNSTRDEFKAYYEKSKLVTILNRNPLLVQWASGGQRVKAYISTLDAFKARTDPKGNIRSDMSPREEMVMSLSLFQNRGKELSHYVSLTHSDKTATPVFANFPRISVGIHDQVTPEAHTAIQALFRAERNRIRDHWDVKFNHSQYEIGKKLFFKFPQFNYENMVATMNAGTLLELGDDEPRALTEADINSLWMGTGDDRKMADDINKAAGKMIGGLLTQHINDLTTQALERWADAGIIDVKKSTFTFDNQYVENILKEKGWGKTNIKNEAGDWVTRWKSGEGFATKQEIYDVVTKSAARDYAVNSAIVLDSMTDIAFGDLAQAAKFKPEQVDQKTGLLKAGQVDKVIAATFQEYSKRLAKDVAPGDDGNWTEPTYRSITMKDVTTKDDYLHSERWRKTYGKVEGTDAQEFTTVKEFLTVLNAHGKIDKTIFDEMMAIIPTGENAGDFYQFKEARHLVVMQPSKPMYAGTRAAEHGAEFVDYIKSSAYSLYPPWTQHFEIEHLRVQMEKKDIARANFDSAQKLGRPLKSITVFNENGEYIAPHPDHEDWEGAVQVLDRAGFRIQQEVPFDEEKEMIKVLTQMDKLFDEGMVGIPGIKFDVIGTGQVGARGLRALKESVRIEMMSRNLEKFKDEIGAVNGKVPDITKLISKLEQMGRDKGYSENELASLKYMTEENGKKILDIPLMFSPISEKIEGLVMTLIKHIIQAKMPGKSYVQSSSVGYTGRKDRRTQHSMTEQEKEGIVWVDGYDSTTPLRTMSIGADGKVLPAQVFVPFNFFVYDKATKKNVKANIKDYLLPGTNILDTTKIPKELLQLVGARIPNQGHNSMLAIEIVGFTPDNMGDIMFVPSAITKQMGSDFDVDKLYTYKRAYVLEADSVDTHETRTVTKPELSMEFIPSEKLDKDIQTIGQVDGSEDRAQVTVPAKLWHDQIKDDFKTLKELLACLG